MADKKKEMKHVTLPEGRLINHSMFEKSVYTDANGKEGTPYYTIELAFTEDQREELEDILIDAAIEEFGDKAEDEFLDGNIKSPLLDGDKLARKREKKNKEGDAYKEMVVIRANTMFNSDGANGPGGIQVYLPDVSEVTLADRGEIYQGCYGIAVVTVGFYEDDNSESGNALKFYLSAFQKTKDGERLVSSADHSKLFKPVGRTKTSNRRTRKG